MFNSGLHSFYKGVYVQEEPTEVVGPLQMLLMDRG